MYILYNGIERGRGGGSGKISYKYFLLDYKNKQLINFQTISLTIFFSEKYE
jgi:hypothetical protein